MSKLITTNDDEPRDERDAPACDVCGSITVVSGECYKCLNCGNSMGIPKPDDKDGGK